MKTTLLYPKYVLQSIVIIFGTQIIVTLLSQSIHKNLGLHPAIITGIFILLAYRYIPFLPYFVLVTLACNWAIRKWKIGLIPILCIALLIYLGYGYIVFRNQFWNIHQLNNQETFLDWWKEETIDMHFSIGSLIGSMYYAWKSSWRMEGDDSKSISQSIQN